MLTNLSLSTLNSTSNGSHSALAHNLSPSCDNSLELVFLILNGIVGLIIVGGNIFTCVVFLSTAYLRQNFMNTFLVSLAISDISMAILVIPGFAVFCAECTYTLTKYCWVFGGARDIAFQGTIFNILAITYDRYIAVLRPLQYPTKMNQRRVIAILLLVWVTPFATASVRNVWQHTWSSEAAGTAEKTYNVVLVSTVVFLPLVIMLSVNIMIMKTITKHRNRVHASHQNQSTSPETADESQLDSSAYNKSDRNSENSSRRLEGARRRKGTISCVLVVFIFVAAWFSRAFYNISRLGGMPDKPVLTKISLFLLFLQSSVNPFIYSFYRNDFRRASWALLKRLKFW